MFPVGRLDRDTEGLLILTNDGELSHLLTHPSHGVAKEYLARWTAARRRPGPCAPCARASSSSDGTDGAGRGRRAWPRASCASSSTRGATARSAGCATPSAIRCRAWCAPASGRVRDPTLAPGRWRPLSTDEVRALAGAAAPALRAGRSRARTAPDQRGSRSGPVE